MTGVLALALGFAAASVGAGRQVERWTGGDQDLWSKAQAILFFARTVVIFGTAGLLWRWTARVEYVAAFVVVGALGQMAGQIGFWIADEKKRARRREMNTDA